MFHDNSFLEVFQSFTTANRWAYHWERKHLDNKIFRHDNIPHKCWEAVSSFPWHFHNGSEKTVESSNFGNDPVQNLRTFFTFIADFWNS